MFINCNKLTTPPMIYATELAEYCCYEMFENCSSLQNAPLLLSNTMKNYCYANMFRRCSSLKEAPELPSIELASYCYSYMFFECTSLINAPYLPAKTLVNYCYEYMFYGCSSLKKIAVQFEQFNSSYTSYWMYNINSVGEFYKSNNLSIINDYYGVPENWSVYQLNQIEKPNYDNIYYPKILNFYLEIQGGYVDNDVKYSLSGKYYLEDNETCDINCIYKCTQFENYYEYQSISNSVYIKMIDGKWTFIDENQNIYYVADNTNYNNPQQVKKWIVNELFLGSNYFRVINNHNENIMMFTLQMMDEDNNRLWFANKCVQSSLIKNNWHHYALTFGKDGEILYIDCKKELINTNLGNNDKNMVFNSGYGDLFIGDINNRNNNDEKKCFIKNISFYDYKLSENNLRKDMLK